MNSKNEIILYQAKDLASRIEVRVEDETVWLNRNQIASLFNRDVKTIGKHINNVFSEAELDKEATVANFAIVQLKVVSAFFAPTTTLKAVNQ
jgi:hypothetical protein